MVAAADRAFLGTGWSFPVALDATGEIRTVDHDEDVRQAIRIILSTNHDERVMCPDFGANLRAMIFEPVSFTTLSLIRHHVERALIEWEPRIDLLDVRVTAGDADRALGRVQVEIDYRVRATNTFYNLVYPFYLIEGAPS
jgi:phage baseplate assembly protein W